MVLLLIAAVLWLLFWLWRTRPWRGPRPRYPIVLVHGFLGFDEIALGTWNESYFRGIKDHLNALGIQVFCPRLPAASSVRARAEALAQAIRALPDRRVNLIAHSMGGVDARFAISALGCADRVASLTTIATPHRGTPIADLSETWLGWCRRLFRKLGLDIEAFSDLSTKQMTDFNDTVPDHHRVRYHSVVAQALRPDQHIHPLLVPSHAYLTRTAGHNDGMVPTSSQRWGEVLFEIGADHWAEIGWSSGLDAPTFYERIARELRRRGL